MNNQSAYLTSRVKEALYNAHGNKAKAMQQIIAWSAQDQQLLQALTRSHLSGIVAYHVDRVTTAEEKSGLKTQQADQPNQAVQSAPLIDVHPQQQARTGAQRQTSFGEALFSAASSQKAATFGLETYDGALSTTEENASQRHIDAMHHIASFSSHQQDKR